MPVGMFPVGFFIGMVVGGLILAMDVGMAVAVLVGMGVYQISMPVLMGVGMGVLVGVLQTNGILDQQNSGGDHDGESHIELNAGSLVQQQDTEDDTQEGSDGVIGTGFGGTQILLCPF